jgi:hypothetical protein
MPPRRQRLSPSQPSPAASAAPHVAQPRSSAAAPPPQIFASSDPLAGSSSPAGETLAAARTKAFPVRKGASSPQDELPRRASARTRAPSRLAVEAAAASSASQPRSKKQPLKPRAQPVEEPPASGSDDTDAQLLRDALEMSMQQLDGNASTSSVSSPLRVTQPRAPGAGDRDEAAAMEQARIASTHEALMARQKRTLLQQPGSSPAARKRAHKENDSSAAALDEGPLHSTPLASLRRGPHSGAAPSSPSPLPLQPRMRSLLDDAGLGQRADSFAYSSDPLLGNDEVALVPLRSAVGEVSLARQAMQRAAQPSGSSARQAPRVQPPPQRPLTTEEEGGRFALIRESVRDGTVEENVARLLGTETSRRASELLRSQDEEEEEAVDEVAGKHGGGAEEEIRWEEADLDPFGFEEAERRVRERREMKLHAQEMQLALDEVAQEPESPLAQCPDFEELEAQEQEEEESTSPPPFLPPPAGSLSTRSSPVQLLEELSTRPPAAARAAAPAVASSASSRRSSRLATRVEKLASPSARRTSGRTRVTSIAASLSLVTSERGDASSAASAPESSTDSASEASSDDGLAFEPRARAKTFASQSNGKGKTKSSSPLKTGRRAVKNTYASRAREPLRVEQMREFLPKRRVEPKSAASSKKGGKKQKMIRISDSEGEGQEEDENEEESDDPSDLSDSRPPGGSKGKGKAAASTAKGKGKKPAPKRAAKAAKQAPQKKAASASSRKRKGGASSDAEEEEQQQSEGEADAVSATHCSFRGL